VKPKNDKRLELLIPAALLERMNRLVPHGGFQNRSEFIREAIRAYCEKLEKKDKKRLGRR